MPDLRPNAADTTAAPMGAAPDKQLEHLILGQVAIGDNVEVRMQTFMDGRAIEVWMPCPVLCTHPELVVLMPGGMRAAVEKGAWRPQLLAKVLPAGGPLLGRHVEAS